LRVLRHGLRAGYLLAFALALAWYFWRSFVFPLRERERPGADEIAGAGALEAALVRQVGGLLTERESSFVNFPPGRRPGVRRVCAFGDSGTYGDAARGSDDFPQLLGELLRREGHADAEVLNFGSPGHGFHQSFLLWEQAGPRYGCELVLLGPGSFASERDLGFAPPDLASPYALHARFVLEGPGLRLVEVPGETHSERFRAYFGFLPRWRTLRYDRSPPALLRALAGRTRRLANPFYYHPGPAEEEARASWRLLLRRMAEAGPPILLASAREDWLELVRGLDLPNLVGLPAFADRRFPYRGRHGGASAWGNALLAHQLFAELTGAPAASPPPALATSPVPPPAGPLPPAEGAAAAQRPIAGFAAVDVRLGDRRAGLLVSASRLPGERGIGAPDSLPGSGAASLLFLTRPGESALEAAILALPFGLSQGAPLALRVESAQGTREERRGSVQLLDPRLPLGQAVVPELEFLDGQELRWRGGGEPERVALLVAGAPVLWSAQRDGDLALLPATGPLYRIAAGRAPLYRFVLPDSSGSLDLVLESPEGPALRVPLAHWRADPAQLPRAARPLPLRLGRAPAAPPPGAASSP